MESSQSKEVAKQSNGTHEVELDPIDRYESIFTQFASEYHWSIIQHSAHFHAFLTGSSFPSVYLHVHSQQSRNRFEPNLKG